LPLLVVNESFLPIQLTLPQIFQFQFHRLYVEGFMLSYLKYDLLPPSKILTYITIINYTCIKRIKQLKANARFIYYICTKYIIISHVHRICDKWKTGLRKIMLLHRDRYFSISFCIYVYELLRLVNAYYIIIP